MNQKFTINVVAILVTFSGALGVCQAQQNDQQPSVNNPTAFGAISAAKPTQATNSNEGMPPIVRKAATDTDIPTAPPVVSAAPPIFQPSGNSNEPPIVAKPVAQTPPPIVSRSTQSTPPPIQRAQDIAQKNSLPEIIQKSADKPRFKANMLAPISVAELPKQMEVNKAATVQSQPTPPIRSAAQWNQPSNRPMGVPSNQSAAQWNQPSNQPVGIPNGQVSSGGIPLYPKSPMQTTTPKDDLTELKAPVVRGEVIQPMDMSANSRSTSEQVYLPNADANVQAPSAKPNVSSASTPIPQSQTYFNAPAQEAPFVTGDPVGGYGVGGGGGPGEGGYIAGGSASDRYNAGNRQFFGSYSELGSPEQNDPNYVDSKGSPRFDYIHDEYGYFGSVTGARWYVEADAIYVDRTDGTIVNSNFGSLGDFNEDAGLRLTIGRRRDVTRGVEFQFFGTVPLEESVTRLDAQGRISALFDFDVLTADSPFFGAVQQDEFKRTEFYAAEFNRTKWGWDVVKASYGLKLFYIEDSYATVMINDIGEIGEFDIQTRNFCVGPHIGSEWFYDVGYRASFSYYGKLGGFVNWNRVERNVAQVGVALSNSRDDNVTLGSYAEAGFIGHFQITRCFRFRFGYTLMYIDRVAGASDNQPVIINAQNLVNSSDSGQMFYNGLQLGLEFYR